MAGYKIVSLDISDTMLARAKKMARELPVLNNSITSGGGSLAGFIGEVAIAEYFRLRKWSVSHDNTYDYDLIVAGKKIDVKTKRCTSPPKTSYECSLANFNTTQKCDIYMFTRVDEKAGKVYLLGWISKKDFKDKSIFHKKGETDSNIVGGKPFKFHADCWNIRIDLLKQFVGLGNKLN